MIRILIGTEKELDTCHADDFYKADVVIAKECPNGRATLVKNRTGMPEVGNYYSVREILDRLGLP